jgi:2-polyprenyl-3-methyl-5-hydroxy-6-metoxy-1,4-benzoquinol methylase
MQKYCGDIKICIETKTTCFEKNGYTIVECKNCGHRFTAVKNINHINEVYSDDYFFEGKDGYPNYLEEQDILYKYGVKYAKIVSKYSKPGYVLDSGCAAGFILKGFKDSGWNCYGIEPNKTMASYGKKELGLDITVGSLETYQASQKFDLVNMIQVIGHFYDIDKALTNTAHLLKPGGFVLIESWNMKSFMAKLMGKNWHEYSPPSVIHWFSDKTLEQLFNYYGFTLVKKGLPSKRINVKHALSLMEGKMPNFLFKKKLIQLLNNSFGKLNIKYPPVDVKWYLFKKDNTDGNK